MSLESRIDILKDRAQMLSRARLFLSSLGLIEVDTPSLSHAAPIDIHIDIMQVSVQDGCSGYLHSSPEYAMKRLIAGGLTDIYQIGHVFRYGEEGSLHNPEFTMVEWYKKEIPFEQIIQDTIAFIQLFVSDMPYKVISYRKLLRECTGIDYVTTGEEELCSYIEKKMDGFPSDIRTWDKDTLLQYIVCFAIEPHLGRGELTAVTHFPASQAALAAVTQIDDEPVGERFEVYLDGIELANGYHELTDPQEQRERLLLASKKREHMGKSALPIDELFLKALHKGLPDCCGVAVGFDRLMMLRHNKKTIRDVMPFSWQEI